MPKLFPPGTRVSFLESVCAGSSIADAAAAHGASSWSGSMWWKQSGVVGLQGRSGPGGGLPGPLPADLPGAGKIRRTLSSEDRAVIAAGRGAGWSMRRIARAVGRDPSVICRELARNRAADGSYVAAVAHRAAHERRRRPKQFKLLANPRLCGEVETYMDDGWSPGLIAAVLASQSPAGSMDRVSHETIYRALYVQTRGGLRADLHKQLSLKRSQRKPRGSTGRGGSPYAEAFTISQRPAEVNDRAVPGDWEGDLILGTGNRSAVGTLVERSTRFTILLHLPESHDATTVAAAMIREMSKLPQHLRRSLTWDRGSEMAQYRDIQLQLDLPVYFCDPHSPWQRGSNENTNRLLRFWLKKSTDLSVHTAEDLDRIAATLNQRPRPTLDLQTPAQRLATLLEQAA